MHFLLLPAILWSPLEQYSDVITRECPKCKDEGVNSVLYATGWTDGSSTEQPRLIHCVNSNVILISRIYSCPNQHRVLGHNPDIVCQFKALNMQSCVPFHLWHISGFTNALIDYIESLCQSGIPLQQIEKLLISNRASLFYSLKEKYLQVCSAKTVSHNLEFPSFNDETVTFWKRSPTRHSIQTCFLYNFWLRESTYSHLMSQTTLPTGCLWLSCDHTFKSVSNIGSVRPADQHWVKQYPGLFCVLNADGEVLSWKLTKRLSFEHIEDVLLALQQRFIKQGKQLEEFYIDNCCSFRNKLQKVFGTQLSVFLDIFHAVQRISKKIPKRHPYYHECLRSLQMVFRDPSDQGRSRTKITPPAHILRQQMCSFQDTWHDVAYNGKLVLPPAAIQEIRNILVHIDRGCLSGILPGRGTNRNERLHKDINSHMTNSRYGVELAYGLITATLFQHNENIRAKKESRCALPIVAYTKHVANNEDTETFGLATKSTDPKSTPPVHQPLQTVLSTSQVEMGNLKYHELQEVLHSMDVYSSVLQTSQEGFIDVSPEDAFTILMQAISAYYVSNTLSKMATTADFSNTNAFFVSFLSMTQGLTKGEDVKTDNEQIENHVASWNLELVPIPGDGNCLFTSIAFVLIQRMQSGDRDIQGRMLALGIPQSSLYDINYLQKLLRVKMVEEWDTNPDQYQGYITEDLSTVSHQFLQSGQFSGDVGDLMLLTIANVLSIPVTVFTSVQNLPLLCVMPTSDLVISPQPLFVAYTQNGPGHYDAVIPKPERKISAQKMLKCNCGRKPNTKGDVCTSIRCKCFRDKSECTDLCRCKSCKNIYGARPPPSTTRRRKSYDEQRQPLRGRTTDTFLKSKGEDNNAGHLTLLENLLFKSIVIYFILNGLHISPSSVFAVYTDIYCICQLCHCVKFPLFKRSEDCVQHFLLQILYTIDLLQSLLKLS